MTTNHRPTLEAKRGKDEGIRNTIAHARALPQQTSLKYRSDIPIQQARAAVEELKESTPEIKRRKVEERAQPSDSGADSGTDSGADSGADSGTDSGADSGADSLADGDSSDSETEQLMKELANIKRERQQKAEAQTAKQDSALASNTLLNLAGSAPKPSWRNSTAFSGQTAPQTDTAEPYTSVTLKSETHKKFISKYIR